MRLDVVGDGVLEKLGLALGKVPVPLVYTTFGVGYARSIVAATRLGFFDALGTRSLPVEELAEATACSREGTRALCAALVGFGLLDRVAGRVSNGRAAQRWLLSDSPESLRDAVLFLGYCHDMVNGLEEDVRSGQVERLHDRSHPPEFWDAYMGALAAFARLLSGEAVRRLPVGSPRKLLDVGGGHGLYSVAFCRKYPELVAEVLDLPGACTAGRRIVAAAQMSDRVRHREADFRDTEWGDGYDLVLLFNVLHNATADEAALLLSRAFRALAPGGRVVVCDAKHLGEDARLDASAGWNELFFYLVSGAQAWPEEQLRRWMTDAGFEPAHRVEFLLAPQVALTARKGREVRVPVLAPQNAAS